MKSVGAIDFVVTWVDGDDPAWRAEKARYAPEKENDDREERYQDWDLMRYWFRGVEIFAPWVRKVHFVTWGHIPEWLNTEHPKLHIVRHEDYIPEKYLPIFNSNALELYLHKIEDLAEQFVYFNDDMFCTAKLKPEDFFYQGKPCDMLAFQPVVANPSNPVMSHILMNNSIVLARHFDKRENVKRQPGAYFKIGYPPLYFGYNLLELAFPKYTGFYTVHGPFPFIKKTFEDVWKKENEVLEKTVRNRFRSENDCSIYLIREWQKLSGEFTPKNVHKDLGYFEAVRDDKKIESALLKQRKKFICINDTAGGIETEISREKIQKAFDRIMPEKSEFEKY